MSGNPASGKDDASGPVDAEAPKEIQILETLRAMRQLVTFSPDDLPEAFANHFSLGQVAEMAARLEDARLVMEADQPPARPTPGLGPSASDWQGVEPLALRESWSSGRYELPPGPTSPRRRSTLWARLYEAVANQAPRSPGAGRR